MSKPRMPFKEVVKCACCAMIFESMDDGTIKLDMKFVAEQLEFLASVEGKYDTSPVDDPIQHARELLAYIDGLPE